MASKPLGRCGVQMYLNGVLIEGWGGVQITVVPRSMPSPLTVPSSALWPTWHAYLATWIGSWPPSHHDKIGFGWFLPFAVPSSCSKGTCHPKNASLSILKILNSGRCMQYPSRNADKLVYLIVAVLE